MRFVLVFTLFVLTKSVFSQDNGFKYGQISVEQLLATGYSRDSSASAIVLREFGEAYVSSGDGMGLIFQHHYLIKILKTEGLDKANISIPLFKGSTKSQQLLSIKASAYNIQDNKIQETQLSTKNIFTEKTNKDFEEKKFTIPNVRVGTIIEVEYTVDDPFFYYNFHTWEFQSDIPKVSSEYWATIPGNYIYNITWRGFLKFTKQESSLVKDCYNPGAHKADCGRYIFAMENIPAFKEEAYMTAKSNFISAVYFELSEVRHFDGRVDKVTKEWKDADTEIRTDPNIGGQLKRGKDIIQKIEPELKAITDPLEKAKRIYSFVNTWFLWNEYMGRWSADGIKKAFEKKTGSVGDINLALIAAMRAAELNVEAALVSTRQNGVPTELHPVITDFNYVVAKVNIGDRSYLVDATDPYLPFGMLPFHCLNGKARIFPEKAPSYWYDIVPTEKFKEVSIMNLTLKPDGRLTGTLEYAYYGYDAYNKRTDLASFSNQEDYLADLKKKMKLVTVNSFEITGLDIYEPKVVHKFDVEIEALDQLGDGFLLNPFFLDKMQTNPFKLSERLYPVNFGTSQEYTTIVNLTYPENFSLVEKPEKNALAIPAGGGKFLFEITDNGTKATMTYSLVLAKPVYTSVEYRYLKELFNRVVQVQNSDWLFKKKK
jgi:transglutaminase-like putative cysteine protease